jgi:flagellar transcriptional activator FlhD
VLVEPGKAPEFRSTRQRVGIALTRRTDESGLKPQSWADVSVLIGFPESVPRCNRRQRPNAERTATKPPEPEMTADQILTEIREANLSYLMLAQSLIRADREQALFRLGVSEETATLIGMLTPAQMMKIASGNTLLCRFRMDDELVWGLLTSHGKGGAANDNTSRLHASIVMAGRYQEAA